MRLLKIVNICKLISPFFHLSLRSRCVCFGTVCLRGWVERWWLWLSPLHNYLLFKWFTLQWAGQVCMWKVCVWRTSTAWRLLWEMSYLSKHMAILLVHEKFKSWHEINMKVKILPLIHCECFLLFLFFSKSGTCLHSFGLSQKEVSMVSYMDNASGNLSPTLLDDNMLQCDKPIITHWSSSFLHRLIGISKLPIGVIVWPCNRQVFKVYPTLFSSWVGSSSGIQWVLKIDEYKCFCCLCEKAEKTQWWHCNCCLSKNKCTIYQCFNHILEL